MAETIHVTLRNLSAADLRELLRTQQLDLDCGGPCRQADGTFAVDAFVSRAALASLQKQRGLSITVDDAFAARAAERQHDVGKGNRFKDEGAVPRGPGRKVK